MSDRSLTLHANLSNLSEVKLAYFHWLRIIKVKGSVNDFVLSCSALAFNLKGELSESYSQ